MAPEAEVITYSLKSGDRSSDRFYQDLERFTDRVMAEIDQRLSHALTAFLEFTARSGHELPRTREEYAFELLTLGVLWRVHGDQAMRLKRPYRRLLEGLVEVRRRVSILKPATDAVRGVLAALLLSPNGSRGHSRIPPTFHCFERLIGWLSATGDFEEEVKRLAHWRSYLVTQPPDQITDLLVRVTDLASWFSAESVTVLGRYTVNVNTFLADKHAAHRFREDAVFCGRHRVEYHLNMVGTEVMNRAFRPLFGQTQRRVVLLPPCMKMKQDDCEAKDTPFGERCAACTPGCRVHQVTKLGEKHGFDVFVLPHELNVFSGGQIQPAPQRQLGVVGVSCPLTNVTGGWETRDLAVPAQGVFLDYCGCSWHWHDDGIMTDININRLLQTVAAQPDASLAQTGQSGA